MNKLFLKALCATLYVAGASAMCDTSTLAVTATQTPEECLTGALGTITATATGGVAPYEFALDDTAFQPATGASFTFSGLAAASHTVTVRDAVPCTRTASVTVGLVRGETGNALTDFVSAKYCNNECPAPVV